MINYYIGRLVHCATDVIDMVVICSVIYILLYIIITVVNYSAL